MSGGLEDRKGTSMAGVERRGREVIGDKVREVSPVSRSQIKTGF